MILFHEFLQISACPEPPVKMSPSSSGYNKIDPLVFKSLIIVIVAGEYSTYSIFLE